MLRIFVARSSCVMTAGESNLWKPMLRAKYKAITALILVFLSTVIYAEDTALIEFNIPRQRADLALTQFAEQANRTFVFPFDTVQAVTTNRLVGWYTLEDAAQRLLAGTVLVPEFSEEGVLKITTGVDQMNVKQQTSIGLRWRHFLACPVAI